MPRDIQDDIKDFARDEACTTAADFYRARARQVIARLFPDFLSDNSITVTELLHRAEMLEKLETTGTLLQFAVQQTAMARKAVDGTPLQQTIKALNKIVDDLVYQVHTDKRENRFAILTHDKFEAYAAKVAHKPDGAYLLNGALARYLRDTRNWNEKAVRLGNLLDMGEPESAGGQLLASSADSILAEILGTSAAVQDIIGPKETFGETVLTLIRLHQGVEQAGQYGKGEALDVLAQRFAAGELSLSRKALGARIVSELFSLKRLRMDSLDNELKMLREVSQAAFDCSSEFLNREELTAALENRSKRFVTPEVVSKAMGHKVLPQDKLDWLLAANECIIGVQNKLEIAEAAIRIATTGNFKNQFLSPNAPLSKRLQRLAEMNARVLRSDLPDAEREKLAAVFDAIALNAASQAKLFEAIAAKRGNPVEKATTLLQLFASGTFTEGRLATRARQMILGYVAQPGFLSGYLEGREAAMNAEAAALELAERLRKVGIPPGESMKAMTASA